MPIENKSGPAYIKSIEGRTAEGVFSVYGNIDSYSDVLWPGVMSKTLRERAGRILHLWQHDFDAPPIAVIEQIGEVIREQLPDAVLQRAPDALGGATVRRTYLDTPRGDEVLKALNAGSPLEMSFAYDPLKFDFEERTDAPFGIVRNMRELKLYETSDVLWGANDATVASKRLKVGMPIPTMLEMLRRAMKGGARHSQRDIDLINQIGEAAIELGATTVKLSAADDPKTDPDEAAAAVTALTPDTWKYSTRLRAARAVLALSRTS